MSGQTISITNSTFGGNDTESGAAFTNEGAATLNHSTIAQTGGLGDGLVNDGVLDMTHTIVADTVSGGSDCINGGTLNDNGYNLVEDGSCITAVTSLSGDPSLDTDYSDNGGPIGTFALIAPSMAIDAGNPSIAAPPTHDQRGPGFPRIIDGGSGSIIDIGAFEYDVGQGSSPFVVNALDNDVPAEPLHALGDPGDSVAVACSVAHCTLQEAIMTANVLAGSDSIDFDIPGAGPHIFQPTSQLATLTERAIIDGSTGPDGTIVLDGSLAGAEADGLTLDDSFFTITNLEISNFDGDGLVVLSGSSNIFYDNSFHGNNGLGIDLNNDGVTPNDYLDSDSGPNALQNAPVLQRVIISGTETIVQGFLLSKPNQFHEVLFYSNSQCDASFFGEGEQLVGSATVETDDDGYATFLTTLPIELTSGTGVTSLVGFDAGPLDGTSEFSRCLVAGPNNDTWPNAFEIPLTGAGDQKTGNTQQYLSRFGQSAWFRFQVAPNSTVLVDMTDLPANYDMVLFRDIGQTYDALTTPASLDDLVELNAEFAPEMFAPEMFAPEMFAPEMFAPEMFAPEMFAPEMFAPEMFAPEMFAPEMFAPEMFAPEMFAPEMFAPEMFAPEMFAPEMFAPEMFAPDMVEPGQRYFINAQAQSAVAVSGYDGTADETVIANTWSETGFFYVRVSGRNGIFNPTSPFTLDVTLLGDECVGLTDFEFTPDVSGIVPGTVENLILVDYARMTAVYPNLTTMQATLATLATQTNAQIVDVSQFNEINLANAQADINHQCVFSKNLVAYAIKDIVDAYRAINPIENVVVVGNDDMLPFFRYRDGGLLANEDGFVPPVEDSTASQASLRLGYVLSQDTYGASVEIDRRNSSIPIPELPVGRLVETPDEIISVIDAFLATGGIVPTPSSALVTGYDFLDDGATAVQSELEAGLGSSNPVDSLISAATVAPENGWNADQMRTALLENGRHDLVFLAGHFSASSALAADYDTRLLASEVAGSSVDMSNSIIFSAGCHSGYNLVNEHGVSGVTDELDWAQVFAQKGAVLIAGTGYQYGDTDFVEYSERLYLEFARALREGTGAVSVGEALVRAKQTYLADTAQMRPIHEKVLLQSTLFGLPMLTIDLPEGRGVQPTELSIVTTVTNTLTAPGLTLGLVYTDVTVTPPITPTVKILENVVDETAVSTLYYVGDDGQVINPAEPILPLDQFNVTAPGTVLRGVGFRGATYTDNVDVIPLTSAATTEIRGIHTPFIATAFYPVVPWEVNYFDALANSAASGETRLSVTPAQYLSNDIDTVDGTWRTFSDFSFRLYYNANLLSYTNTTEGIVNTPALASRPDIVSVLAEEDSGSGDVLFDVEVTGDPSAGMQEVWITWTACDEMGVCNGLWQSVGLVQDANISTQWAGTLPLGATPAANVKFVVQAANGVGLVSLATNKGAYYTPGLNPGDPTTPPGDITPAAAAETTLTLNAPPTSGVYSTNVTFTATLTSDGVPLVDKLLEFGLTTQRSTARTDANGVATVDLTLVAEPTTDVIRASFAGEDGLAATAVSSSFTIDPIGTTLTVETTTPTFASNGTADLSINLSDSEGRALREKTAILLITNGTSTVVYSESIITNLFGNVELQTVPLTSGTYDVSVVFGDVVTLDGNVVDLSNLRYLPSSTQLTLISNMPPTAHAGGPYSVNEGDAVLLDASSSSDINAGQALSFAWDLDDNGTYETDGVTTTLTAVTGPASLIVGLEVCDPVDECDTATASVTVNTTNLFPIINDDNATTNEDTAVTIDVLFNDSDPDGDTLTIDSVTQPVSGTAVISGTIVVYTPTLNFNGSDSFTYTAIDGNGGSGTATVTVAVNAVNDAPVALDDDAITDEDMAISIDVLVNDTDLDGDSLTLDSVTQPVGGTAVISGTMVVYTPTVGFSGSDSFDYTISDGNGGSDSATVTVTVNPTAGVPFATCGGFDVFETAPEVYDAPDFLGTLIVGDDGYNYLRGTNGVDLILGLGGPDDIFGRNGDDIICGGNGFDIIYGQNGNDTLYGGNHDDWLVGGKGDDILYGGAGWDNLFGSKGQDMLYGGAGYDLLRGGSGADGLFGGAGPDDLYGQQGDDNLDGGDGNDFCKGDSGTDTLASCES